MQEILFGGICDGEPQPLPRRASDAESSSVCWMNRLPAPAGKRSPTGSPRGGSSRKDGIGRCASRSSGRKAGHAASGFGASGGWPSQFSTSHSWRGRPRSTWARWHPKGARDSGPLWGYRNPRQARAASMSATRAPTGRGPDRPNRPTRSRVARTFFAKSTRPGPPHPATFCALRGGFPKRDNTAPLAERSAASLPAAAWRASSRTTEALPRLTCSGTGLAMNPGQGTQGRHGPSLTAPAERPPRSSSTQHGAKTCQNRETPGRPVPPETRS